MHLSTMDKLGANGEDGGEASKHVESWYERANIGGGEGVWEKDVREREEGLEVERVGR